MPLTLLRQEGDIRQSETYDDSVAPTEAAFETNPTRLEDDLNNIRSQVHNLLKVQAGNWWDDLNTPTALDTGSQRGVNDLNTDLHALERKRVLRDVHSLTDVTVGASDDFVILGTGELPANTTAAVGAVTTAGTVAAFHSGTFGTHSLDEVAGTTAIAPKNLCIIVDGASRDPILSDNRTIYALLQTETATDGHTITDTTTTRAQLSFVRINSAGSDLEAVPAADIQGKTINYCTRERVALDDLNEQDFLKGAIVDDVAGGSTATRQSAYDNQGATAVDLTTNATLDLEGAGLVWSIRDDLEATLLSLTEGSAGGTSTLLVGAAVDTFDVDAVANDFLNGATFGTTGTGIQVAENAGIIERAADLTLRASGAGELVLDDSYRSASTWSLSGIRLADSAQEWSDFETEFGEVSLLAAIEAASTSFPTRTYIDVTAATIAADTDTGGPSTAANNLDVDYPDSMVTDGILNTFVYLNGVLMRPGANAAANNDYYPGTTFTAGDVEIKWERALTTLDQIWVVTW